MINKLNLIRVGKFFVSVIFIVSVILLLSANHIFAYDNTQIIRIEKDIEKDEDINIPLNSVKFVPESVDIIIPYGEYRNGLEIQLENTTGEKIEVYFFVIKNPESEKVFADLSFGEKDPNEGKNSITVTIDKDSKTSFKIKVDKVERLATYAGEVGVEIYKIPTESESTTQQGKSQNDQKSTKAATEGNESPTNKEKLKCKQTLKIIATKSKQFFTPKLKTLDKETEQYTEVKSLKFQYTKKGEPPFFYLKNPEDGSMQEFKLDNITLKKKGSDSGSSIKVRFDPNNPILEAGEVKKIKLALPNDKKSLAYGIYEGDLDISDSQNRLTDNGGIRVRLINSYFYSSNWFWVKIILFVFLGAFVALIIDVICPRMADKINNIRELHNTSDKIDELTRNGSEMNSKLAVMKHKAKALNDSISFYGTKVASKNKKFNELLSKLKEYLEIVKDIKSLRDTVNNHEEIPKTLESEVLKVLNNAEQHLIDENKVKAEEKVKEAKKQFETTGLMNFQKKLTQNIKTLKKNNEKTEFKSGEKFIEDVFKRLKGDSSDNAVIDIKELIQTDKEYRIIDLYLNKYKKLNANKQNPGNRDELITHLENTLSPNIDVADKAYEEAELLIESISLGITLKHIEKSLKNNLGQQNKDNTINYSNELKDMRIRLVSPEAYFDDILKFKFDYLNSTAKANESRLAKRFTYSWNFGDNTKKAYGKESFHYFNYKSHKKTKEFSITVEVKNSNNDSLGFIRENIPVKRIKESYRTDLTFIEMALFLIPFFLAVIIASLGPIDKTQSLGTLQDYMTPFLLGLSSEQGKDMIKKAIQKLSPPT